MSDFYVDFRPIAERNASRASLFLKFFPDIQIIQVEQTSFSLVLTSCDDQSIWGPYRSIDSKTFVALAGRIALEDKEWNNSKNLPGNGGLACKAIYALYRNSGISGLQGLNGSYVAMVFDAKLQKFFLVSDRCGMFPFFKLNSRKCPPVFSSHPDLLALVSGYSEDYDTTSLCEFIMAGQVSFPFSYYRGVSAAEFASIHTVNFNDNLPSYQTPERYFHFNYTPNDTETRLAMAERLSVAFKNAVRRRTHPELGSLAIALSGGLDSRLILCACPEPSRVTAFCFYDEENLEYNTARTIADAKGIKFVPLKRDFEHYGNSAEAGVRISGGMSSLATNHYLGFREQLRGEGFDNILTGLYFDYFFKGLALNRRTNVLSRKETPTAFSIEWYQAFFSIETDEGQNVNKRLESVFPIYLRQNASEQGRLEIEKKRLFPLSYEPENTEVLIPQRVIGWYMPILDNDVIDVYLTVPPRFKVDNSMFKKVVEIICGSEICRIPDSNTGAPVGASYIRLLYNEYVKILQKRYYGYFKAPQLSTSGSWQNLEFYIHHSRVLQELWVSRNHEAVDLFKYILGYNPFEKPIIEYRGRDKWLFLRLLTLKIWLDLKKR